MAPGATAAHDAVLRREAAERLWIVDPIDGTVIAHSHRIIIIISTGCTRSYHMLASRIIISFDVLTDKLCARHASLRSDHRARVARRGAVRVNESMWMLYVE